MDCKTDESCNFKRRREFNLHDVINTKEAIKNALKGENMQSR